MFADAASILLPVLLSMLLLHVGMLLPVLWLLLIEITALT
jgi:hypothetical protein